MRGIVRWTIGPCSNLGIETLFKSVQTVKKLYPMLDRVICYNEDKIPNRVKNISAQLYRQEHVCEMEYKPKNELWKLYPPRLDASCHEIFLDNDVVLVNKCSKIDQYLLSQNHALIYEGIYGLHGKYSNKVPKGLKINSGVFGLPPNFDFAESIKQLQKNDQKRDWAQRWDDQGVVGSILGKLPHFMITQKELPCCEGFLPNNKIGYHFIGINKSKNKKIWFEFKRKQLL